MFLYFLLFFVFLFFFPLRRTFRSPFLFLFRIRWRSFAVFGPRIIFVSIGKHHNKRASYHRVPPSEALRRLDLYERETCLHTHYRISFRKEEGARHGSNLPLDDKCNMCLALPLPPPLPPRQRKRVAVLLVALQVREEPLRPEPLRREPLRPEPLRRERRRSWP